MLTKDEAEYIKHAITDEYFQENDRIDFKAEWHNDKGELVKDLLSFANTYHHNNCYIVIGVEDKTKRILGIDKKDSNRRNTQNITDLIGGLSLAQNSCFSAEVNQLSIDNKLLDVIIIEDSNQTPFFLSKRGNNGSAVHPGLIYCRRKDTNTSKEKVATDKEIENLYKKRLHLDQDIFTQFKYLLMKDYALWNKCETIEDVTVIFHQLRPDFYIKIYPEETNNRSEFTAFSIQEIRPEIGYYKLQLCYHNIAIKVFTLLALDEGRKWIVWPKFDPNHCYYYEYTDSIEYFITLLLNHKSGECPYNSVVLYTDQSEKDTVDHRLNINFSEDEIINQAKTYKNQFRNEKKVDDYELKEVVKRYLVAREIKNKYKL